MAAEHGKARVYFTSFPLQNTLSVEISLYLNFNFRRQVFVHILKGKLYQTNGVSMLFYAAGKKEAIDLQLMSRGESIIVYLRTKVKRDQSTDN